ncbi:uncharacterized protein LOC132186150 isoform X2 [Corylus avellana]|uniref:uncharacterized protein LOC132186150 isoform X2 n=1 Tax=Corylus avellana TaxID=13451 RepID=UPI00286AE9AA|nr:uncharacterized protein LOC132186150 isoform X2 [Corylus avellana]
MGAKCLISSCYSKDFVLYVGGHVWALDWCPRVHERLENHIKCEFIAIAAHPPGSSYHKIGASLTGTGVIQIWCLLNISVNEEEVPPLTKKQKRGSKNSGDMKEKSTVVKGPRGRPRKMPKEDDNAIATQLKRPKGRPRKIQIEKYVDDLDCNDLYAQDLAVQLLDDSSELLAIDWVSWNAQEHAVQEENGKKQAASACNPAVETPMQGRRLKNRKRARSYSDNISPELYTYQKKNNRSPELLTQNEDMGSSVTNHEIQHNSEQESAASDNFSHNGSLGISSPSCMVSNDVALPRVVLCLAHNGKVAWDVKWRPSNACDSKCKHRMGYLAVLLGNGSLEVWEVPFPRTMKAFYSSAPQEGTDPRFAKLEPVFRCSMLKCGGIQSRKICLEHLCHCI